MYLRTLFCLVLAYSLISLANSAWTQDMEQEPIVIKGENGVPGTIYIAPWKKLGGALDAEPLEPEYDLDTQPLEREVFLKQLELRRDEVNDPRSESIESSSSAVLPTAEHD
jgi:hypothetical protein